jgi:LPXTG-site transpeptidase (sortase) family protein
MAPAAQMAQAIPTVTVPLPHVRVVGSDFTFLDPPEPGANVHLTVLLQNDEPDVSSPLALSFRSDWFGGYRLESSTPALVADRPGRDRRRRLVLNGLTPGVTSVDLNLVSTAEGLEPPQIQLEVAVGVPPGSQPGSVLGTAQPPTAAPPPRPGPVMALRIPRIGLSTAVVPTSWEPPAFVVGQLQNSAAVTLGNTVLVGHVSGAAGTVFAHLDQLEPGDDIVAISRGVEYRFMVIQTFTGAADDSSPIDASHTPRLTLMTCTGTWEPFARSYSDRLWVIAEPESEFVAP